MEKQKSSLIALLTSAVIAGNILFVLWILYNGINEHFQGTMVEKLAYVSLMILLSVNAILLIINRRK
jgi:hypothetical protein